MLDSVDESLERFMRSAVPLSARNTDVSFEAPDRQWAAKLNNRPTVNLFLCDIKRSTDHSRTGMETFERNGQRRQRLALPRVELRYLISTWTTEHADGRVLMSGLLRVLLGHAVIPEDFLADSLRGLSPLTITMTRNGEAGIDVCKALDGQLKPPEHVTPCRRTGQRGGRRRTGRRLPSGARHRVRDRPVLGTRRHR